MPGPSRRPSSFRELTEKPRTCMALIIFSALIS